MAKRTTNEELLDAAISHAIDLHHYSNGVVRKIVALLNRSDADLYAQLAIALERLAPEAFSVQRLDGLLHSVRTLNAQAYNDLARALTEELARFTEAESPYQIQLFRSALPAQIVTAVGLHEVAAEQAFSAAVSTPFQGRLLGEWAKSMEESRMVRVRDALRIGFVEQQTIQQMTQRIRGTRKNAYADGILEIDRRSAESVVRTAVGHVAAHARNAFFRENAHVIDSVAWVSTLDTKTSEQCRLRDNKRYAVTDDGKYIPLGHKYSWGAGPGALHWNCRSTSAPVTKSWKELGIDIGELSESTRASMDGQVPGDLSYGEWLSRQSEYRQDEILGPVRGELLRNGGLTLEKFANDKGQWLTLDQLRERNAAAFKRAGIR